MALTHAWALWLLPLSLLPFVLHRRADDASRIVVSALHLWPSTPPPPVAAPRTRWFIVDTRRSVLASLIALIVIALASPTWRAQRADVVLIVDTSASMGARVGGATRLDRGRDDALKALAASSATRVRLIAAGASPDDRGRVSASDLRQALAALMPGATESRLGQTVAVASTLEPGVPVWVVSDHAVSGVARGIVASETAANVGVTALVAEAEGDGAVRITAQLESTGATRATLAVLAAGQPLAQESLSVDGRAPTTWTGVVHTAAPSVEARLTPDAADALSTDNARAAVVARSPAVRVRIDGDADGGVALAIAANPAFAVTTRTDADVVVCRRCPDEAASPATLRLSAGTSSENTRGVTRINGPTHPVTSGLAALETTASVERTATTPGAVLAHAGAAPLVSATADARGRTVTLHADDGDPSFTRSAFFAVLVANAVDWLAGRDNPVALGAGEPLRWWVGPVTSATLSGPDGRARASSVNGGWLTSTATSEPGVYSVVTPARTAWFAVNPPAAESALSEPAEALAPASAPESAATGRSLAPWLLAAALLLLLVEWRRWPQVDGAPLPRAVGAMALALAALGVTVPAGRAALDVVFAIDRSDSVAPRDQLATLARAADASRRMPSGDTAGLLTFGQRPRMLRAPSAAPLSAEVGIEAESAGTNIDDAIRAALPLLPRNGSGRIVLASDGWETDGHAEDAAAVAADRRVAIDVLPVRSRSTLPFVRSVSAPAEVRAGEPFAVDIALGGPAGHTASMTLDGGDRPVSANVALDASGTGRVRLNVQRATPGLAVLRARTGDEPDPTAPGAAVMVLGPPRVLHVTATGDTSATPVAPPGYRVDRIAATQLTGDDAALAAYQAVVLDRVPGETLPAAAATALARWTGDGGGLVVLGSQASLPPGGYANAAIDALLPVDVRVAPGSRTPAAATVVAIDKSGSMADTVGGLQKIEAARSAVRQVRRVLAPDDTFGVVAFDVAASAVATPGPAARNAALDAALSALTPGGATRIAPAVEMAAGWLTATAATERHLLVVSDGRTSAEDLDRAGTLAANGHLTLSVIAIGADADRAGLTALAARTGGRVYFPATLAELPRLAAGDAVASRGGATITTAVGLRASTDHPVLAGLELDRLPSIEGYVVAAPRTASERVLDSTLSDPVVIAGRAGLGRVVVVTTDLGSTWSTAFRRWSGYGPLMTQVLQWTSRRDSASGIELAVEDTAGGAAVRLWFERGAPAQAPVARVRTPDDRVLDLRFHPTGAQLFTAELPAATPGLYRIDVTAGDAVRLTRGFVRQADRERSAAGLDDALLDQLAARTGGRRLTAADDPFDAPRPIAFVPARPVPEVVALIAAIALAAGSRLFRRAPRARHPVSGAAA